MKSYLLIRSLVCRGLLAAGLGMLVASHALADRYDHHHHRDDVYSTTYISYESPRYQEDYGRVIEARPIYQRVAVDVPRQSCDVRTVAYEERRRDGDSFAGTVLGGLVGAAIGHELGNGRGAATAAGGLIGASIGNDASRGRRAVSYRDQEVCSTRYRTEYQERIVGYDVSYSYRGRVYQTQTDRHPGDRIAVAVDVHPRY